MSVSLWSYREGICDGGGCVGDCDLCDKPKNMEDEDTACKISIWTNDSKCTIWGVPHEQARADT